MVSILMIIVFIVGYVAIALEHSLKLNKAASALITGVLCWTIHVIRSESAEQPVEELLHHLGEISSILFFLLAGATPIQVGLLYCVTVIFQCNDLRNLEIQPEEHLFRRQ